MSILVPRHYLLRNKVNRVWYNATKFRLQALESRWHQSDLQVYRYIWELWPSFRLQQECNYGPQSRAIMQLVPTKGVANMALEAANTVAYFDNII